MKGKLSFMWRATLALVLVLSLGVVMAVPVAADVSSITVTPDPTTTGVAAEYTVVFTTTAYLMAGTSDKIYIEFPVDTDIAGYTTNTDVTVEGTAAASVTVDNQILEITVPASGGDIAPGSVTVILAISGDKITNPTTADDYTLDVWTNEEPTHVESNPYTITAVVDTTPPSAVTVGAPNGAETWAAGSTQSITWSGGVDVIDSATTIKLEYSDDAGSNWTDITTLADTSLTGYSWTVPSVDSTNCLVKVTATDDAANSVSDVSDAEFTIDSALPTVAVTAPNGGEVWVENSSHDITWTCTDTDLVTDPIDIDYSADGGATWTRVASDEPNDGTYDWTIPAVYSTNCLVKVTATDDAANSGSDESNAVFTIDDATLPDAVTVIAPNGAETWAAGSTQSITWSGGGDAIDTATTIKLEYSADAGSSWTDITTLADTADTSYSWTVPSIDSANCLVKIMATDDAANSSSDVSDAVFSITAATEVWVDDDGNDLYPGTEALPFKTIQKGINEAGVGGTVNVGPGTYTLGSTLTIAAAGLTLQSTGTAAETIIDCDATYSGINITAADATVDGFTVLDAVDGGYAMEVTGADAIVTDNIMTAAAGWPEGIAVRSDGALVSGNELDEYNTMMLFTVSDCTLSDNTFDAGINVQANGASVTGIIITSNDIIGSGGTGIVFQMVNNPINDVLIEGNTISQTTGDTFTPDAGISFQSGTGCITNLRITGNDITDNEGVGIGIHSGADWGTGNTINNNNISGNLGLGIDNDDAAIINASNNWWGDDSGPYNATTNSAGTGDAVDDVVDYTPWLTAAYAMPADPVTSATISLVTGWNLISLPIIPTSSVIATVLADLITDETVDEVRTYDQGDWDNWASTGPAGDLTIMADGAGYWIDMNAADSLVVAGSELPAPPATPPSYSVYTGWNMIGFKSVDTDTTVAAYLGTMVAGTLEAIYGYDAAASAYFIPGVTTGHLKLEPGCGYWLAVNAAGTIYP